VYSLPPDKITPLLVKNWAAAPPTGERKTAMINLTCSS
jgi:hypothetical protein